MGDPITDRMREKYEAEVARLREERDTARKQREGQRLRAILAEKYAESAEARLKTATDALREVRGLMSEIEATARSRLRIGVGLGVAIVNANDDLDAALRDVLK